MPLAKFPQSSQSRTRMTQVCAISTLIFPPLLNSLLNVQYIRFPHVVETKVHLRSSLLSSMFSEACYIKRQWCSLRCSQMSQFFFFLWPFLYCRPSFLHIAYWLAYIYPASWHVMLPQQPATTPLVHRLFGCHLCTVPQCTANYPQQVLQADQELWEEGRFLDHSLVNRIWGSTFPKSINIFYPWFNWQVFGPTEYFLIFRFTNGSRPAVTSCYACRIHSHNNRQQKNKLHVGRQKQVCD